MTPEEHASSPNQKAGDEAQRAAKKEEDTQEFGKKLMDHLGGEITRADTKAQFILTVDALLLASTTLFEKGIAITIFEPGSSLIARLAGIFSILMFITLLVSTILAITAIIPRLTPPGKVNNLYFYGTVTDYKEHDFIHAVRKQTPREMNDLLLSEVHALAKIAQKKFIIVRRSYQWLFLAVGFWILAQGLVAFIK